MSAANPAGTVLLLVEDDAVDVEAMRRALEAAGASRPLVVAGDGIAALARLRGEDGAPPPRGPLVVVLDLSLPRMGGAEFLAELRADPRLRALPVFVLTTSDEARHRARIQRHLAAGYFVKSHDQARLTAIARLLDAYCELAVVYEAPNPVSSC